MSVIQRLRYLGGALITSLGKFILRGGPFQQHGLIGRHEYRSGVIKTLYVDQEDGFLTRNLKGIIGRETHSPQVKTITTHRWIAAPRSSSGGWLEIIVSFLGSHYILQARMIIINVQGPVHRAQWQTPQ